MPTLIVETDGERRRHELDRDRVTVGRGSAADLRIHDRLASRTHCRIDRREKVAVLQDVGSQNGTFLNGEQISADEDDAFSYCAEEAASYFVFRSAVLQSDEFAALLEESCEDLGLTQEFCGLASLGLLTKSTRLR